MWLSAIVPLFVAGFGNLTVQGKCCQNFEFSLLCSFFIGEDLAGAKPEYPDHHDTHRHRHVILFVYSNTQFCMIPNNLAICLAVVVTW